MQYTTKVGDRQGQAHINYERPCGCRAGLTYDHESGSEHLGMCCCGRLLWVGGDAVSTVRGRLEPGIDYEIDMSSLTPPWGDMVVAALAVPQSAATEQGDELPARVRNLVCWMTIDPRSAAATSIYQGETFYFCAPVCKQHFDVEPALYVID